jgi:hypothetical protein
MKSSHKAKRSSREIDQGNTERSQDPDLSSSKTHESAPSSHGESLARVFIITEVYLSATSTTKPNGAGVRTLAVFNNVAEANAYATAHVSQLQHLTRPRRVEDGGDDEFRGTYLGTPLADVGPDGEMTWTVEHLCCQR